MTHQHPVIANLADQRTRTERWADTSVAAMGSVRFIAIQTVIVAAWIAVNLAAVTLRWDPYPFILLNLAFSTQAAYAAPLILLAGRRADLKRDQLAHHDDQLVTEVRQLVACLHRSPATGTCTCNSQQPTET